MDTDKIYIEAAVQAMKILDPELGLCNPLNTALDLLRMDARTTFAPVDVNPFMERLLNDIKGYREVNNLKKKQYELYTGGGINLSFNMATFIKEKTEEKTDFGFTGVNVMLSNLSLHVIVHTDAEVVLEVHDGRQRKPYYTLREGMDPDIAQRFIKFFTYLAGSKLLALEAPHPYVKTCSYAVHLMEVLQVAHPTLLHIDNPGTIVGSGLRMPI